MPRLTALSILRSKHDLSLRAVDRAARENGLDDRDRALLRKIIGVEVRRRGTLHALANAFAKHKLAPGVRDCLAIGLVQLFFLDTIPDHAAVSETVSAAAEAFGPKKAQMINACLRAALRMRRQGTSGDPRRDLPLRNVHLETPVFQDPAQHPLLWAEEALSMPVPLMKRWIRRYGEERAFELARDALEEPDISLRLCRTDVLVDDDAQASVALSEVVEGAGVEQQSVDAQHGDAKSVVTGNVELPGVELRNGLHPDIRLAPMKSARAIVGSEAFRTGRWTVQGETALRAAELVEAKVGERVLDLCAAPGGKTAVLAQTGASVTACDDDERRVVRLRETLARLLPHATNVEVRVQDGAAGLEPASFDAVLVDVPCSNTGVLAARPAARWRFSTQSQQDLAAIQTRLLGEAATCVKPGGRLVYSTCSIEPEENQRRVRAFVAEHPEFSIAREIEALPAPRGEHGPVDGGYAARLVRAG
jgi:16S rRNA (cytosine967-C5)-methyltransferase